jgi:hypothetical protein
MTSDMSVPPDARDLSPDEADSAEADYRASTGDDVRQKEDEIVVEQEHTSAVKDREASMGRDDSEG